MEFDLIGVDSSIANAIRRILIAEVPTMAIEKVYMLNNTGIIADEILSHRLGLVPVRADPRDFNWKEDEESATDRNTIVFKLRVNYKNIKRAGEEKKEFTGGRNVYSRDLVWEPKGDQAERFASEEKRIQVVDDDILLTKLGAGQSIECELHCVKGIGKDHAKFSPVATATYRLHPDIELLQAEYSKEEGEKLVNCFPKGVLETEPLGKGKVKVVVKNARLDTVSREVLRHDEFADKVVLSRVKNHFIFNIESTGAISPPELLIMALEILASKCGNIKNSL
ncbi:DNA-directed RNA polymerases I and III subunit RPAC1 [Zancudomyces culisetae]|uniref:DNA-directed RNA polymerases I and III subunit RPAC1 n=1 Tax=Zancudomyces culisetae TaxID=1213189 RepID=A0A1R1PFG4_ZANCU|nr:DNA-directed RNA polymerases I and III subunit RPAC1 [Zancudomyces culisetae]|eukprot:OMH79745.1 DNA-directed RNA polymerases I and III subunit RPAC1 [Zancudomyces culisetae]